MNARRASARTWLGAAVTLVCLSLLVWIVGPARMWEVLSSASPAPLAAALVVTPVVIGLRIARWHVLARVEVPDLSASQTTRSYLAGVALALLTPIAAGELARGTLLPRGDQARLAGLTLVDKVLDLTWVGLLALGGLGLVFPAVRAPAWGLTLAVPLAWAVAFRVTAGLDPEDRRPWHRFTAALTTLSKGRLATTAALAGLTQVVFVVQAWIVLSAFAPQVGFEAVALWPAVTLSTIVPAFVGGLGVRELTALWLLPSAGVDAAAAAQAAFAQFVLVMAPPGVLGALFLGGVTQGRNA